MESKDAFASRNAVAFCDRRVRALPRNYRVSLARNTEVLPKAGNFMRRGNVEACIVALCVHSKCNGSLSPIADEQVQLRIVVGPRNLKFVIVPLRWNVLRVYGIPTIAPGD